MLMLLFPYDAHLVVVVIAVGAWIAHWRREHATVRRLKRLVRQDRQQTRDWLGL